MQLLHTYRMEYSFGYSEDISFVYLDFYHYLGLNEYHEMCIGRGAYNPNLLGYERITQ